MLVPLNDNQFVALVSFSYNVGCGAVAHSSVLNLVNAYHLAEAADSLLLWTRCTGQVLPGLVRRRTAERELLLTLDTGSVPTVHAASYAVGDVQDLLLASPPHPAANDAKGWPAQIADTVGRWLA